MDENMAEIEIGIPRNSIFIADDRNRAFWEYANPLFEEINSGIVWPKIQAQEFELKPVMLQMLQFIGQFGGQPYDDPHQHIRSFVGVCDSFKMHGVSAEALRMRLFPYSLRDMTSVWLDSLSPNSVSTWKGLTEKFLMKYFPSTRIAELRRDIISFQQEDGESFIEAWERFKELLWKCPHHGFPYCIQMETFYNGLDDPSRLLLDAFAKGSILAKSYNEAFDILEAFSSNNSQWSNSRASPVKKATNIHELNAITTLASQVEPVSSLMKAMLSQGVPRQHIRENPICADASCVFFGDIHTFDCCPSNPESACFMGNSNPNHGNQFQSPYNEGFQQNYQQQRAPHQSHESSSKSFEEIVKEYMANNDAFVQSQAASLRNLEFQFGQFASEFQGRYQGILPNDIENSRKGKEQCQAVKLRNGKEFEVENKSYGTEHHSIQQGESSKENVESGNKNKENKKDKDVGNYVENSATEKPQKFWEGQNIEHFVVQPPFPQRLQKQKQEAQFKKFLDVFKQLQINIFLVEALEQMPNHVKFLKDILMKKRRLGEFEMVALTEGNSAILKNKIPVKLKEPGSFTIPCSIGGCDVGHALCDLGASINLMPLSIFNKLGIGEARPTTVTLQLADRSVTYPEGKIEDVLVRMDKFIFPVDFLILDYQADHEVPIILGRPFLATGRTLIDVEPGGLTMRVNDDEVKFKAFNSLKYPDEAKDCSFIDVSNTIVAEMFENVDEQVVHTLSSFVNKHDNAWERFKPPDPSKIDVHIPKPLALDEEKKEQLEVLRRKKEALQCCLANRKGIFPIPWVDMMLLEENKTSVEKQKRLNLVMKKVVKKIGDQMATCWT